MVWHIPERAASFGRPDPSGDYRLHYFQPSINAVTVGTAGDGRTRWQLPEPMAGVVLFGLGSLPVSIDLPGGLTVDLAYEAVPGGNLLNLPGPGGGPHWIDTSIALRIRLSSTVLAEGRWQHAVRPAVDPGTLDGAAMRFAAGLCLVNGTLTAYAHAGDLVVDPDAFPQVESSPVISSASPQGRNASPFGRGMTLTTEAVTADFAGTIEIRGLAPGADGFPAGAWYAHAFPLEETLALKPDAATITARDTSGVAWGRDAARVAIGPLGWRLAEIESGGHIEWTTNGPEAFAGASRIFRGGNEAALVPAASHRSNVSSSDADNSRLTIVRGRWDSFFGWSSGQFDLPLQLGAWNEYRPAAWGSGTGASAGGLGTLTGSFLGLSVSRASATNLGGITAQADAVEVTRLVVRWLAAVRYTASGTPTYSSQEGSAVLSAADGAALLSGAAVTIADPYTQGTYPTPAGLDPVGTLTIQAVG
jgi:hypothetical protein